MYTGRQGHVLWLATRSIAGAAAGDAAQKRPKISRVLILIAMEAEGTPLLSELEGLKQD
eukprot:COSAG03_NODE_3692_length_1875_cov_1.900338_2_plen_58_part_01